MHLHMIEQHVFSWYIMRMNAGGENMNLFRKMLIILAISISAVMLPVTEQ